MNEAQLAALEAALPAMSAFKLAFGRDPSADFVAELYATREFDLQLPHRRNEPGYDAVDSSGRRYQVKLRSPTTQNVDINNFDFDYIVLVNLDDGYLLTGLWRLDAATAQAIFVHRPARERKDSVERGREWADSPRPLTLWRVCVLP